MFERNAEYETHTHVQTETKGKKKNVGTETIRRAGKILVMAQQPHIRWKIQILWYISYVFWHLFNYIGTKYSAKCFLAFERQSKFVVFTPVSEICNNNNHITATATAITSDEHENRTNRKIGKQQMVLWIEWDDKIFVLNWWFIAFQYTELNFFFHFVLPLVLLDARLVIYFTHCFPFYLFLSLYLLSLLSLVCVQFFILDIKCGYVVCVYIVRTRW